MTDDSINRYGDKRVATSTGHGVDIASQRADDLDLLAVDFVRMQRDAVVLDAGCGHGGQAARLAKAGAMHVTALDIEDYKPQVLDSMRREGIGHGFSFFQASVEGEPAHVQGPFDAIMCQRMIHYLRYRAAVNAVTWFHRITKKGGRLFISASGMDSELGNGYAGRDCPLSERFSRLEASMAEKHAIYPPVCLYRQDELELVVKTGGWTVEKAFLSSFGNVKIVARKDGDV